jgi:hypothetical protein
MKRLDMATTVIILYSAMMLMQVVLNIFFYIKIRKIEKKSPYQGPPGAMGAMGPKGERGEPGYTPTPDYIKELIKQVNDEHKG